QGLSTVDIGKCAPPKPARYPCNVAIDTLAGYARQSSVDAAHPECAGFCNRFVCADAVADGAACTMDLQCARGRCEADKCTHAPLPAMGEACAGACAAGARCVKGKCAAPKAEGESCEVNEECRAMCAKGKCDKLCAMPSPHVILPSAKAPKPPPKR